MKRHLQYGILLLVVAASLLCFIEAPVTATPTSDYTATTHRIVAIGDIHGDPEKFSRLLTTANVATIVNDEDGSQRLQFIQLPAGTAAPPRTSIIQMGDLIDRGRDDRQALNIAFDLLEGAQRNRTAFDTVLLLGNHELLNLQKNFHYVNSEDFGGFVNKNLRSIAFDAQGPYGKFIIDNFKTVHIEADSVFVHAGITPDHLDALQNVNAFNEEVRVQLRAQNYNNKFLNSRSPLWTRQTVFDAKAGQCGGLQKVLDALKVNRMIVGHTPERNGHIGEYCGGKLFTIDVGLSRWMFDRFAALEITVHESPRKISGAPARDVTLWELTLDGRRRIWPPKSGTSDASVDFEDL